MKNIIIAFFLLFAFSANSQVFTDPTCNSLFMQSLRQSDKGVYTVKICGADAVAGIPTLNSACNQMFSKDPDDPKRYCLNMALPPPDCEDCDPTNELQTITIDGDVITLSDGGTITIIHPIDPDPDPTNEIQVITSNDGSIIVTPNGIDYDLSIDWGEIDCDAVIACLPDDEGTFTITPNADSTIYTFVHGTSTGTPQTQTLEIPKGCCLDSNTATPIVVNGYTTGYTITVTNSDGGSYPANIIFPELDCEKLKPCIEPVAEDDDYCKFPQAVGTEVCYDDVIGNDNHPLTGETYSICGIVAATVPPNLTVTQTGNTICVTVNEIIDGDINFNFDYIVCDENGQEDIATVYIATELPPTEARVTNTVNGAIANGNYNLDFSLTKDGAVLDPADCIEIEIPIYINDGILHELLTGNSCDDISTFDSTIGNGTPESVTSHATGIMNGIQFAKRQFAIANGFIGDPLNDNTQDVTWCINIKNDLNCADSENLDNCTTICTIKNLWTANNGDRQNTQLPGFPLGSVSGIGHLHFQNGVDNVYQPGSAYFNNIQNYSNISAVPIITTINANTDFIDFTHNNALTDQIGLYLNTKGYGTIHNLCVDMYDFYISESNGSFNAATGGQTAGVTRRGCDDIDIRIQTPIGRNETGTVTGGFPTEISATIFAYGDANTINLGNNTTDYLTVPCGVYDIYVQRIIEYQGVQYDLYSKWKHAVANWF